MMPHDWLGYVRRYFACVPATQCIPRARAKEILRLEPATQATETREVGLWLLPHWLGLVRH